MVNVSAELENIDFGRVVEHWLTDPTPTRLSSHIRLSCRPLSLHLAATAALALTLGRRHHPAEISGEQETERVLLLVLLPSTARAKMRIDQ